MKTGEGEIDGWRTNSSRSKNAKWHILRKITFAPTSFIAKMSLNYITKKFTEGYKCPKSTEKLNDFQNWDDIKLYAKK